MMQASLFEVWKLTQRTLEGAGVPDGHDREGAFAVQWLCERGFPGFEMFGESQPEMAGAWGLSIVGETGLQAAGSPLVSLGADVMDYCVAAAEISESGEADIIVQAARGPVFLLPFATRRCQNTGACRIHWTTPEGLEFTVTVAGPETVWINSAPQSTLQALCAMTEPVDVTVSFDRDGASLRAEEDEPTGNLLSPQAMNMHRAECLSHGIEITQPLWDRMAKASRAVLVPESEHSRKLGAGGGDAND